MKAPFYFALVALLGLPLLDAHGQSGNRATASQQAAKHLVAVDDNGLAVQGYDPVAFFTDGKPVKGAEAFSYKHQGATWRFATAEHLKAFREQPEKYSPAYGGYCAWGVGAKNDLFPVDINRWKIVKGKLYLNYNAEVQQSWLKDVSGFIQKADANWPSLVANKGK